MKELLNKLKLLSNLMNKALLLLVILEALMVIFIGIASNYLEYTLGIIALIISILIYLILLNFRFTYQKQMPNSIAEEFTAVNEINEKNNLLDRQINIHQLICDSIQALNSQTCEIGSTTDDETFFCENGIVEGLSNLLKPILKQTDILFNNKLNQSFTIGVFFKELPYIVGSNTEPTKLIVEEHLFVLKDDQGFDTLIPRNISSDNKCTETCYEIKTSIQRTLNNNRYEEHTFTHHDNTYNIITSPIPTICSDDENIGVFFLIVPEDILVPDDLKKILGIFNRLIINYKEKYNKCIYDRISP